MSSYTSSWPTDSQQDPAVAKFFEQFYKISDTPDGHETYANQFTRNATLVMVSKKAEGRDAILKMRQGMWERIVKRSHNPIKIFPFGNNADEVMLYGTVDYVLKTGGEVNVDWSARAHLSKEEGELKMDFYQVYLDSAAQQPK